MSDLPRFFEDGVTMTANDSDSLRAALTNAASDAPPLSLDTSRLRSAYRRRNARLAGVAILGSAVALSLVLAVTMRLRSPMPHQAAQPDTPIGLACGNRVPASSSTAILLKVASVDIQSAAAPVITVDISSPAGIGGTMPSTTVPQVLLVKGGTIIDRLATYAFDDGQPVDWLADLHIAIGYEWTLSNGAVQKLSIGGTSHCAGNPWADVAKNPDSYSVVAVMSGPYGATPRVDNELFVSSERAIPR